MRDSCKNEVQHTLLYKIQNTLFVIGSNLAASTEAKMEIPNLEEKEVIELEQAIDKMEEHLPELKNFVLPGGHPAVSHTHIARSICRRAERKCVTLDHNEHIAPSIIPYLNRLSDYFFVLGRQMTQEYGAEEVIWKGIR